MTAWLARRDSSRTNDPAPLKTCEDPAQPELFADDFAQPDANDGEPVFWTPHGVDAFPPEDFVQPDNTLEAG